MSTEVKIFAYAYLEAAPGGATVLRNPYIGGEVLTANAESVTSKPETAGAYTQVISVQVEAGKGICFEITPQGHPVRTATQASPNLAGDSLLNFGPGWTLSVIERAAVGATPVLRPLKAVKAEFKDVP